MEEFDLSKYEITNPDEEFDLSKYEILNPEIENSEETLIDRINRYAKDDDNKTIKYGIDRYGNILPEEYQTPIEDITDDLIVTGKSFLKGVGSIADLPKAAASGLESMAVSKAKRNAGGLYAPDWQGDNIEIPDTDFISSKIPDTADARAYLKEKTGIDLEPHPTNAEQRMLAHGAEFAGSMIGTGGTGAFVKGGKAGVAAYKPTKIAKDALTGMSIGTGSGALQEVGVNPLAADIGMSILHPTSAWAIDKSYNTIKDGVYSVVNPNRLAEIKLNRLINNASFIKRDKLGRIIDYKPSGEIIPVTAEIAKDSGISALHNTYSSTLPQIRNTQLANDAIYRNKLNNIGTQAPLTAEDVGLSVRNTILDKLNKLKGIRKSETAPLYAALDASKKLYPVKHFSHNNKTQIKKELGDTKKILNETSAILFNDVKSKILAKKQKMLGLQQKLETDKQAISKKISTPSESTYRQIIPDYDQRIKEIAKIKKDIKKQANNFTAAKLDKASTAIGNKILQTKKSDKRGDANLIRQFQKQKDALELDLASTPEGLAARQGYAKHSKPINEIEEDKLLQQFLKTDEVGNYKYDPDKAIKKLSNASEESSRKISDIIRDTEAGEDAKKYLIDLYTEKTRPEWLPTAARSKSNRKTYGKYHEYLMTPEEKKILDEIDEYLQNRALHASGNFEGVGSATAPREHVKKEVQGYFGGTTTNLTPKFAAKYIPSVVQPNRAYGLLEEFLADPRYAQKTLRKKPKYVKTLKDRFSDYYKSVVPIINNNLKKEE